METANKTNRSLMAVLVLSLVLVGGVLAQDITIDQDTTWVAGTYTYQNVHVTNTARLTFDGAVTLECANLTVDPGSSISADGKGYGSDSGPGAGQSGSGQFSSGGGGGGYGGSGGASNGQGGSTYGSVTEPVDLGSGGGNAAGVLPGGAGGGAIRLVVQGTLKVDGNITANGTSGSGGGSGAGGGGSAGSIYLTVAVFEGNGSISSNGGNSGSGDGGHRYGGGGGGGRIAIYCQGNTFTGIIQANGGIGANNGQNGTVALFDTSTNDLTIYNGFDFRSSEGPFVFNDVSIRGAARVTLDEGADLVTVNLSIGESSVITVASSCVIDVAQDLLITGSSTITHVAGSSGVHIRAGNLTLEAGSSISADGKGYGSDSGPGAGQSGSGQFSSGGGGGGYGGPGGTGSGQGGSTYGSPTEPVDLGSGGGNAWGVAPGGTGGGAIRLVVQGTLKVDGNITANGKSGSGGGSATGGGGSGGSIYLTVAVLEGAGSISASGGNSGSGDGGWKFGGGGGGGRIAIYCQGNTFTGIIQANGGINNGQNGTIKLGSLVVLSETTSSESILTETLVSQNAIISDAVASGGLNGTLNFTEFEMVGIATGSFAGKGFSKAQWSATLESLPYQGSWQGMFFLRPNERKIYLKGAVSGELSGTVEGFLSESTPESGIYDQYQAEWKIGKVKEEFMSCTVNLTGTLSYQESAEYPGTEIYVLQTSVEGQAVGDYTGALSTVLTHLRVADEDNPYYGEGFSIISYVSESGQGEGWTYDKLVSASKVDLNGLFDSPLFGIVSGALNETGSPRTLLLRLERVDLSLPPMADLEAITWGPGRVSSGETVNYIIEYRNDGLKSAENVVLVTELPILAEYKGSTQGGIYIASTHRVFWILGTLNPKHKAYLSVKVGYQWGIPEHTLQYTFSSIKTTSPTYSEPLFDFDLEEYLTYQPLEIISTETLSLEEIANELLDPQLNDLFNYGIELGYTFTGTATRTILTDASTLLEFVLTNPPSAEVVFVIKAHNVSFLVKVAQDEVAYFDREGGTSYNVTDNSWSSWGQWAVRGSCSEGDCIAICHRERMTYCTGFIIACAACKRTIPIDPLCVGLCQFATSCISPSASCIRRCSDPQTRDEYCCRPGLDKPRIVCIPCPSSFHWFPDYKSRSCEVTYVCRWPGVWEKETTKICGPATDWDVDQERNCWTSHYCKDGRGCDTRGQFDPYAAKSRVAPAVDPSLKYGPEGRVSAGQQLNYMVKYENEGEGIAFGVYFTDTLDEDLDDSTLEIGPVIDVEDGSMIAGPGIYNPATRTITWFAGEVGPGKGGITAFDVDVRDDAEDGTEIINYATIYFPSVPEVTRTNGIVSIVTINQPVDDLVSVSCGLVGYDRRTGQFSTNVTVTNTSSTKIDSPVWLVIESISPPEVTLANPDGTTLDGKPYVDLSGLLGNGQLDPAETISKRIYFNNPSRLRFTFEPSVRGLILP